MYLFPEQNFGRVVSSRTASIILHGGVFALLWFAVASAPPPFNIPQHVDHLTYIPPVFHSTMRAPQSGGGQQQNMPILKSPAAAAAPRVFVAPAITDHAPLRTLDPALMMEAPTMLATGLGGNPLGSLPGGAGPGFGGAGGPGDGGIGRGTGPGKSDGGGTVYEGGKGITPPVVKLRIDPEYSEEARKAKISSSVLISLIVNPDGAPGDLQVARGAGLGLDEKALEAVAKWKFEPGTKDGKKVRVRAFIEVFFRLF